ncbi:M28 family peptidase [Flavobacteriaceae bacterium S356]|uniref:M28 family peptidase n=1 Tax=Asprobacillus argus TaxID=3076534 RepID=A0ABU3LED9_9FLAO|nr:M28 family peptidase [Flavobacteriaceae bacterium S356]
MEIQKIKYYVLLLFTICISCVEPLAVTELPKGVRSLQKSMVGHLSGAIEFPQGHRIASRWSKEDKILTCKYLNNIISQLTLIPENQHYNMPNLNPGVDLVFEPYKGVNIYTVLPATVESDEYIVLGAHYDTGNRNVPGAIDNATGMTLIYTVTRELSKMKHRNKHVILVFFDQEEEELIGSSAFARLLLRKDYNVHSVHTFDMVGWDGDHNKEVELEMPAPFLEKIYAKHAQQLGIPIYTTQITSTDHYAFIKKGFDAVGVSQAYAKRDNSGKKDTPEDTYDIVNFDYLQSTTQLAYKVLQELVTTK